MSISAPLEKRFSLRSVLSYDYTGGGIYVVSGDAAGRVKYIAKSDRIDEKQYGILFCLDALGFTWKTDLGFDGCEKFTIYQPGTRR